MNKLKEISICSHRFLINKGFKMEINNQNIGKIKLISLKKTKKDFLFFKEIFGNKDIMKTISLYDRKVSKKNFRKDFDLRNCTHKKYNLGSYKITNDKNDIIGITSLLLLKTNKQNQPTILEFEYFISPKFQSKRIGSDTAKFLIDYAFKNFLKVKRIYATALTDNFPSQIIMHRLGFKYIGKKQRKDGGLVNLRYITKFRFYLNKIKPFKRKTNYYIKLIKKLNKKKSKINLYNTQDL